MTATAAHLHAMDQARRTHSLRTVHGHAYPVPEGELMSWLAAQARRPQRITRMGARFLWRKAFRSTASG